MSVHFIITDCMLMYIIHSHDYSAKEKGVLEIYYVIGCGKSIYFPVLVALSVTYKLVLHAVALVLAFFTRNIKVDVLNDYRYNTAIIIGSSFLLLAVCFTLPPLFDYINWYDAVWSIEVFLFISLYLGLTFIPKVVNMA